MAPALKKIISNQHFRKRVSVEEQSAQKYDRFLRGRQIAYMIYDNFRATGAYDAAQNLPDLFNVSLHGDDIQDFDTSSDQALLSSSEIPQQNVLEGFVQDENTRFCSASDSGQGRTSEVPNLRVHAGREGRTNVLPWYRQVGVASTSSQSH